VAALVLIIGCVARGADAASNVQERADRFLELVNAAYKGLYTVQQEAQWVASTDVSPAHDAASETAGKAAAAFNGNPAIIREAQALLKEKKNLREITWRELERVILNAAEGPMTNPDLVKARIEAETQQASILNGFEFKLNGKPITVNEIDNQLSTNRNLTERKAIWEASKESGVALKPGLVKLQKLRNGVAKELGYHDYFALQVASYGMTTEEMVALQDNFMREMRPLYLQLHTWVKHELAKRYGQPVPKRIPAHWLNNRWSQEWPGIVEAADMDPHFKGKTAEWVVKSAEQFYTGLGFAKLPQTFWERSDLYPVKPGETRKKNTHASCWHVDLEHDIRSLMSVEPNDQWFHTAHHELGHAYYFMSYTRPEVPPLLRIGANPAFHEGMGELISLAAGQVPYLQSLAILPTRFQSGRKRFPIKRRARQFRSIYLLGLRHHDALGSRHLCAQSLTRTVECALVEIRSRFPGRRTAHRTRRRILRRRHQNPHQRQSRLLLFLRHRDRLEIPMARSHRAQNPSSAAATL
jgi:peptidyl-dipeptidase A